MCERLSNDRNPSTGRRVERTDCRRARGREGRMDGRMDGRKEGRKLKKEGIVKVRDKGCVCVCVCVCA
jgi:hypothetical protein